MSRWPLVVLALFLLPVALEAQSTSGAAGATAEAAQVGRLLERGDAAFARRDTAAARIAYEGVLQIDAAQSRAVYQLGRLQPAGSRRALELFARYVELEPADAWGHLALGEACEAAGEPVAARAAFRRALALEPDDAEMRAALARVSRDAATSPASGVLRIEPIARASGDSDRNRTVRAGVAAGIQVADSLTLGASGSRIEVSDDLTRVTGWEGVLFGEWRPRRSLQLSADGGAVSVRDESGAGDATEAVAHARLRWRPSRGPSIDLRVRREPIAATPLLFATPVVVTEGRATVELPLVSILQLRGMTRYGRLRDAADTNERTTWSAGPLLRLSPAVELSGMYARTAYARPTSAGYFAPRRVEALDAGVYFEHYGWWPLTIAVDAGGGVERVTPHENASAAERVMPRNNVGGVERATSHDDVVGEWERALHLWSKLSWAFSPRGELRLELEAYETQVGDVVAAAPAGWRWGSIGLALSWRP